MKIKYKISYEACRKKMSVLELFMKTLIDAYKRFHSKIKKQRMIEEKIDLEMNLPLEELKSKENKVHT